MRKLILLLITLLSFSSCIKGYSGWVIEKKESFMTRSGGIFTVSHPRNIAIIERIRVEEYTFNLYNIGDTIR